MDTKHELPIILSLKMYDEIITFQKDKSDITDRDFMEMIERLLLRSGFSQKNIKQYIIEWGEELKSELK